MPTSPERPVRRAPAAAALLLALVALAAPAAVGCTLTRVYRGTPIRMDAVGLIEAGVTTKGEVLTRLGAPDGIVRQFDGDIFVYRYVRRNTATLRLEEPVVTRLEIFSWTRSEQRHDSIVVLFDREGVVQQVGTAQGTDALPSF